MNTKEILSPPYAAQPPRALVEQLLGFFYPIHYRLGMDLETVMCRGRIARKQAAILWLIHSSETSGSWVRRKEIETSLATWFEMSNSNVSKLLRELAGPTLQLIRQEESPESGREKVVCLTPAGRAFVGEMVDAAIDHLSAQLTNISVDELRSGIRFLAGISNPDRSASAVALD
ncbi:MarR family winged helix-turn-helix transcriptional regulator [Pseudomonas aeruginosa]